MSLPGTARGGRRRGRHEHDEPGAGRLLLEDVHARLSEALSGTGDGPRVAWGPDHEDSSHPSARQLRTSGHSFDWLAVTFPGWSLWHLHLGLVPREPGVLALGVHWHASLAHRVPRAVTDLAAAGITTHFQEESGEHQADLLVLAHASCPRPRGVQVLSDTALDLVDALDAPLAAHAAARPTAAGATT